MNKYSFFDVLTKEIDINDQTKILINKIEIPMIQRDYAQGRTSVKEIRKRFLDSIFQKLGSGEPLELDFVYGSLREYHGRKAYDFIPLDGQQRLTTLFLLYWYIGYRELEQDSITQLNEILKKFSYATRISSRRFCENLVKEKITYKQKPQTEIKDLAWFYKSYTKDPTIKSMLTVLDDIHEYYEQADSHLYSNLQEIKFYLLPLDGFNLSEELYIKMNARGKQLTDFENFKADLINWMKDEERLNEEIELNNRRMPKYLSFSEKIDVNWAKMFWTIIVSMGVLDNDNEEDKITGPLMFRFFNRFLTNHYIVTSRIDNKRLSKDEMFNYFYNEGRYSSFYFFRSQFNSDVINNIETILDKLTDNWSSINRVVQPVWGGSLNFFDKNFTQSQRVIFHATTTYLMLNEYEEVKFKKWIRIVWNIVENTDINDVGTMASAIHLVEKLSENANDIYNYMQSTDSEFSSSKEAVLEEKRKAIFIMQEPEWEDYFISAESHGFFKGSIDFIITDEMTFDEFEHRRKIAFEVFDEKGVSNEFKNEHIFLRALISQFKSSNDLIGSSFTDSDEKEHYLKKMLVSNIFVKNAIREWFNLENKDKLINHLLEVINEESEMLDWNGNKNWRITKVHTALYKESDLQNWMQNTHHRAYRINWRDGHIYVSRPSAWYDWIMLDTHRNEIIKELLNKEFLIEEKENRLCLVEKKEIPYFRGNDTIVLKKKKDEYIIEFSFKKNDLSSIHLIKGESVELIKEDIDLNSIDVLEELINQVENKINVFTDN